ncbi:hypothetical protein [Haloactinomyces albus]|uniref:Uncharacterized protein n=1 Tax=Haloactinomyces albus TaxID=1352928 RepID=A0AAE4CMC0_9ACTN|nr:hypothetical protein [Haloactinomyces albus]MDR7300822.1 hypothetical protein [Haloactinomyces albus]
MRIRTDDEIYRVDAVWLGPPKATFPWRARYVAWGVGIVVFLLVLAAERRMNIGFGFFSTAWAVIITIAVTRIICSRISHERPLSAVLVMWLRELTAPRKAASGKGGAASAAKIRVNVDRPHPQRPKRSRQYSGSGGGRQHTNRSRKSADRSRTPSRRARNKEVRGVRSRARS